MTRNYRAHDAPVPMEVGDRDQRGEEGLLRRGEHLLGSVSNGKILQPLKAMASTRNPLGISGRDVSDCNFAEGGAIIRNRP